MTVSLNWIKSSLWILGALACVFASPPSERPNILSWEKPLAPGLVYREEIDYAAKHSVYALRISLASAAVRPVCALAGGKVYEASTGTGRAPVSQIVRAESAIAGVNGDFFSMSEGPSGEPLGLAVRDGRILSTPSNRLAFGWGPGVSKMSSVTFKALGQTDGGTIPVDGINRQCPNNQITLNTEDAGQAIGLAPSVMVRVRLTNPAWRPSTEVQGVVVSIASDSKTVPIAPGEAVLVARGTKVGTLENLKVGARCDLFVKTVGFDWSQIDSVVGGGPALVRNSEVAVDSVAEGFGRDFSESKHPRTAIGRTAENDLWLVAVDGRQETGDGMTLAELAQLMKRLGCVDAMNLDGGGSTTMNVCGVTVNRPSDGKERSVADAVVLLGPRRSATSDPIQISAPQEVGPDVDAFARVLDQGTPIPNIEIIWGASGACTVDGGGRLLPLSNGSATITAYCRGKLLNQKISVRRS